MMPQLESELETSRLEVVATCIQLLNFSVHLYRSIKERISKPKGKKMAPLSSFHFARATIPASPLEIRTSLNCAISVHVMLALVD